MVRLDDLLAACINKKNSFASTPMKKKIALILRTFSSGKKATISCAALQVSSFVGRNLKHNFFYFIQADYNIPDKSLSSKHR